MTKAAKKRKTEQGQTNNTVMPITNTAWTGEQAAAIREQSEAMVAQLSRTVDKLEESDPAKVSPSLLSEASMSLFGLKILQRQVLEQMHKTHQALEEQRLSREDQERKLENLKYQKVLNEHSIHSCQNLETSQLIKLCRSELRKPTASNEDSDDSKKDSLLEEFLGADPKDPIQRAVIVDKLNQHVRGRKKLQAELKRCQQQASRLKQSLASKRKLMKDLPTKLKEVERASLPLQKFCQQFLNATKRVGTKRRTNLDLAASLPKPLYTLFYQLQSSLDAMENSGELDSPSQTKEKIDDLPTLEVNKDSDQVILTLSIPTISDRGSSTATTGFGTGKKLVVLIFEYSDNEKVVTVLCSKEHDMECLLVELFPDDTGIWTDNDNAPNDSGEKRPYHWCNYLAGLHLPSQEPSTLSDRHKSSAAVLRALIRRVRAQATMCWIAHALSRKVHPIPVHPALKHPAINKKDNSVKLVSWREGTAPSGAAEQCFLATLKRKGASLSLRVRIHTGRYPSIPPTWEFNPDTRKEESLDSGETPLYDDKLATLERHVNKDIHALVVASDETTYDWILAHQLSEIASKWEEHLLGSD